MTTYSELLSSGLLNKDSDSLGDLASQRAKARLVAFCLSQKCTRSTHLKGNYRVEKSVSRSLTYCPDCHDALYWTHVLI